jgi:hypothetical protein
VRPKGARNAGAGYSNSDVPVIYFIQRCQGEHALWASSGIDVSFFNDRFVRTSLYKITRNLRIRPVPSIPSRTQRAVFWISVPSMLLVCSYNCYDVRP